MKPTQPPAQMTLSDLDGCADGQTYDHDRDHARLSRQREDVFALMQDRVWRTLREISRRTGHPEASVSARLRDFRKQEFGGHTVGRRYLEDGLWEYQLLPEPEPPH